MADVPYFEANGITLYHGDCRDILPTLGPVDHVITDPPYARDIYVRLGMPNTKEGSGSPERLLGESFEVNSGARMRLLAEGAIGHIDDMLSGIAYEIRRLARRWAIVWCDVENAFPMWRSALDIEEWRYIRAGAWVKDDPSPQFTGDRPAMGFETCVIAHPRSPMRWNGGGYPAVWRGPLEKGASRPDHPCPKPIWLMRRQVDQFTDPGETILDPFCGSGTTLVAAYQLGRRAVGIELEERWAEVTAKRLEREMAQGRLFQVEPEKSQQEALI